MWTGEEGESEGWTWTEESGESEAKTEEEFDERRDCPGGIGESLIPSPPSATTVAQAPSSVLPILMMLECSLWVFTCSLSQGSD